MWDVTAARMRWKQGNVNCLVSAIDVGCSCSASAEQASPVCGTDGQTYSLVCADMEFVKKFTQARFFR